MVDQVIHIRVQAAGVVIITFEGNLSTLDIGRYLFTLYIALRCAYALRFPSVCIRTHDRGSLQ